MLAPYNDSYEVYVFVPSRGFLFFYKVSVKLRKKSGCVFVPSRGFLFFYKKLLNDCYVKGCFRPLTGISLFLSVADMYDMAGLSFSSPHGDFSFSIEKRSWTATRRQSFRPLTGISLFLWWIRIGFVSIWPVFVPSRGFLFFYRS